MESSGWLIYNFYSTVNKSSFVGVELEIESGNVEKNALVKG